MTAWGVVVVIVGDALLALPPNGPAVQELPPPPALAEEGASQAASEPTTPSYRDRPPAAEIMVRGSEVPAGFVLDDFRVDEVKLPKDRWSEPTAVAPGARALRYSARDEEGQFVWGSARVPIYAGERYEFVIPKLTPQRDWVTLGIGIGMIILGGAAIGATAFAIHDTTSQPADPEGDPVAGIAVLLEIAAAITGSGIFVGGLVMTGIGATPKLQFEAPPERPALVVPSPHGLALGLRF